MAKGIFRENPESGVGDRFARAAARIPTSCGKLTGTGHGRGAERTTREAVAEIIRGLNATGAGFDYYYYRTGGGAEVDLILEGEFGLIPIEIKYTQTVPAKQLRALKDFIRDQNCPFGLERIRTSQTEST